MDKDRLKCFLRNPVPWQYTSKAAQADTPKIRTDSRETAEASVRPLTTRLERQGLPRLEALREARKRLGLP